MQKVSNGRVFGVSIIGATVGVVLVLSLHSRFRSGTTLEDRVEPSAQVEVLRPTLPVSESTPASGLAREDTQNPLALSLSQMVSMGRGGPSGLRGRCRSTVGTEGYIVIACEGAEPSFGGMYAQMDATPYRNKRIRVSGSLRANDFIHRGDTETVGALWIRIQTDGGPVVNNGADDGVKTSGDWVAKELTEYVSNSATMLFVGTWMEGYGQLWVKDLVVTTED